MHENMCLTLLNPQQAYVHIVKKYVNSLFFHVSCECGKRKCLRGLSDLGFSMLSIEILHFVMELQLTITQDGCLTSLGL